jgi:hypothetical protein
MGIATHAPITITKRNRQPKEGHTYSRMISVVVSILGVLII